MYIGGYGINLSEIDDLTNKTDSLSKKLLEHGVTGFCPTIISIKEGYEKVSVTSPVKYVCDAHWLLGHTRSKAKERWINWSRNNRLVLNDSHTQGMDAVNVRYS